MYYFAVENEYGNKLELTGHEREWQLASVTGLNSPNAEISTSIVPTFDGERFNSSRMTNRNIVIAIAINGNVERNRNSLNSVILPKRYIKVYYKNNSKNLYIEGHVEAFEYDVFSQKVMGQISIICNEPFWKDVEGDEFEILPVVPLLEFPLGIPQQGMALSEIMDNPAALIFNNGLTDSGVDIMIGCAGVAVKPWITNTATGQRMEFDLTLDMTQEIKISTTKGHKRATLLDNGAETNILMKLNSNGWITLNSGANAILIGADSGAENLRVAVIHRNEYGGV